jgi:hypothetical protein
VPGSNHVRWTFGARSEDQQIGLEFSETVRLGLLAFSYPMSVRTHAKWPYSERTISLNLDSLLCVPSLEHVRMTGGRIPITLPDHSLTVALAGSGSNLFWGSRCPGADRRNTPWKRTVWKAVMLACQHGKQTAESTAAFRHNHKPVETGPGDNWILSPTARCSCTALAWWGMIEQGIRFEPTNPPDPEEVRVVPADMRLAPLLRNGRAYLSWKISDAIRLNESRMPSPPSPVLDLLISPDDARAYAQMLLEVAEEAEGMEQGGSGIGEGMRPPGG